MLDTVLGAREIREQKSENCKSLLSWIFYLRREKQENNQV